MLRSLILLAALTALPASAQEAAGVFLRPDIATGSADIVIDAAGRFHAAYTRRAPDNENPPALYATCKGPAEACLDPSAWREVEIGVQAQEVQVEVTPEGRPRLLVVMTSQAQPGGLDYAYAACDGGCADPAGWTLTPIATSWDNTMSSFTSDRDPQRTFALDPQGRPRFLYSDRNYLVEPDHYGTFYMSCDANCADRANWTETDIARHTDYDTEIFDLPALGFTPGGQPRLVARIFGFDEAGQSAEPGVYYLACDADCAQPASWRRVMVIDAGGGSYPSPSWDLAIDAQGRPHLAFFAGDGMEQADLSHTLIYASCAVADCTLSDEDWIGTVVLNGHGEAASIALDAEGRPRLAFRTEGGDVGVAACDAECGATAESWTVDLLEEGATWAGQRPTALPFTCDAEVWEALAPEIALDPQGRSVVAFDVSVEARCLYQEFGEPEITYSFHPLWRGARLALR